MEAGSDLRIKGDQHVLLLRDRFVTLFDAHADPVDERLADDSRANVADPLLRHAAKLLVIWHVRNDGLVLHEEREDLLELQRHVRWHVDMVDAFHRHKLALSYDQVFQEVDRDRVERRKVTLTVHCNERVNLCVNSQPVELLLTSLAAVLSGEGRTRDGVALMLLDLMRLHLALKDINDKNSAIASCKRANSD